MFDSVALDVAVNATHEDRGAEEADGAAHDAEPWVHNIVAHLDDDAKKSVWPTRNAGVLSEGCGTSKHTTANAQLKGLSGVFSTHHR